MPEPLIGRNELIRIPDPRAVASRSAITLLAQIGKWIYNRHYYPTAYEIAKSKYMKRLKKMYPDDWQVRYNHARKFVLNAVADLMERGYLNVMDVRIRSLAPTLEGWKRVNLEPIVGDNRRLVYPDKTGNGAHRPIRYNLLARMVRHEIEREMRRDPS
jgi:hypothetical protein